MDDRTDGDGIITFLVRDYQRLFSDSAHAHDGRVWLIDDGQTKDGAELAGVGDGEGGTFDVLGLELLVAGAFAEIGDAALQAEEVEVSGILEDGDDESPIEGHGDSDINVAVVTNAVTFERGIDDRPLLDRDDSSAHEERHEREADSVALLERVFVFGAQ